MKGLLRSFYFALCGVFRTVWEERNFRIHLTAVFFVSWLAVLYEASATQAVILVLVYFNVLALELINTAVENAVDHASRERTGFGKRAKDAAAGAVLLSAVSAVVVAVLLFRDGERWRLVWDKLTTFPRGAFFLCAVFAAVWFVFFFGKKKTLPGNGKDQND